MRTTVTSAWVPASDGVAGVALAAAGACSHWSAAAKARAAFERPDPGGPVNSQAWLIPWPADRGLDDLDGWAWPTRSSQTVMPSLGLAEEGLDAALHRGRITSTGGRASRTR